VPGHEHTCMGPHGMQCTTLCAEWKGWLSRSAGPAYDSKKTGTSQSSNAQLYRMLITTVAEDAADLHQQEQEHPVSATQSHQPETHAGALVGASSDP
jgi:hypothetical protein